MLLLLGVFVSVSSAGTTTQWKERAIFQVLTDRIQKTDGSFAPCDDFSNYCGGEGKEIL